jgi:hypothetical protein
MTTFYPPRRQGLGIGLALLGLLLALDSLWLGLLIHLPDRRLSLLWVLLLLASLPALAFVISSLIGLARLAYILSRDALTIRWGFSTITLPLSEIQDVLTAEDALPETPSLLRLRGLYWPGRLVGPGRAETFGPAHFYATRRWPDQVLVIRGNQVYILSPADPAAFQAALTQVKAPVPAGQGAVAPGRPTLADRLRQIAREARRDRLAQALIGAGAGLNLLLFGTLAWLYPRLPQAIPLHFDQNGVPDLYGTPAQAFILPAIGLVVLILNSLLGGALHALQERLPAYLLWSTTILVQVMLWAATFGLST